MSNLLTCPQCGGVPAELEWPTVSRESGVLLMAALMAEISEECYCAGWLTGLSESLWRICQTPGDSLFGMCEVTEAQKRALMELSRHIGGWVEYEQVFIPIAEWKARE